MSQLFFYRFSLLRFTIDDNVSIMPTNNIQQFYRA